jgi:Zn-dependent metalloprotease
MDSTTSPQAAARLLGLALALVSSGAATAAVAPLDAGVASRLSAELGSPVSVSYKRATGAPSLVRLPAGSPASLAPAAGSLDQRARAFFAENATSFGLHDQASELLLRGEDADATGARHLTYLQRYQGVPVFAAQLRAHFDKDGRLYAVDGTVIPGIDVDANPTVDAAAARERALASAIERHGKDSAIGLTAGRPQLMVYRLGLDQGVAGPSRLVWEVLVGNGGDLREWVYVDAASAKVADVLPGVYDDAPRVTGGALNRRGFLGTDSDADNIPDAWPNSPEWVEGNAIPTGTQELDNMLLSTADVWNNFYDAFGRDGYNNLGTFMDSAHDRNYACPNASWNGSFISFCPGFTTHDVTAHEWGHAYTEYTHHLIYRWQSGALNEAYSDMWGEIFDLNRTLAGMVDTDAPSPARTAAFCTTGITAPPKLTVNSPAPISGDKAVGTADFGPGVTSTITQDVVLAIDGTGADINDACEPLANAAAINGKIAFVNRGACSFYIKTLNAQAAGAALIVIGNVATSATPATPPNMGCVGDVTCLGSVFTITTVSLNLANADAIRANIGIPVNASAVPQSAGEEASVRWLMGEDVGGGALRDMWNPVCFNNPGKVTDNLQYVCGTGDNGGVHTNSGVPNHAFALLVDGGTYNGHTVVAIGRAKASKLIYQAQTLHQGAATDFSDHADAMELSCTELIGTTPIDPWGGAVTAFDAADCTAVQEAMLAVAMRSEPTFCNFQPLLAQSPPALCTTGFAYASFNYGFEGGASGWTVSRRNTAPTFDARDWSVDGTLPGSRAGNAFQAPDPNIGNCTSIDETGVLVLDSPTFVMPIAGAVPRLAFDQYVASEATFDGGNVKISVNGGPYTVLAPSAFGYNPQTGALATSGAGNTNPMQAEQAWHGTDGGSNSGTWGRTISNSAGIAAAGQPFKLRYEFGSDGCGGTDLGWWVDDIKVYTCETNDLLMVEGFETGDLGRWSALSP